MQSCTCAGLSPSLQVAVVARPEGHSRGASCIGAQHVLGLGESADREARVAPRLFADGAPVGLEDDRVVVLPPAEVLEAHRRLGGRDECRRTISRLRIAVIGHDRGDAAAGAFVVAVAKLELAGQRVHVPVHLPLPRAQDERTLRLTGPADRARLSVRSSVGHRRATRELRRRSRQDRTGWTRAPGHRRRSAARPLRSAPRPSDRRRRTRASLRRPGMTP